MPNLSTDECREIAGEIRTAMLDKSEIRVLPSSREYASGRLDWDSAYAIEAELARVRSADGFPVVGRKVGFANKAMWRALKLETLLWASMYSDTVHQASHGKAELSLATLRSPKIEPEVMFKLKPHVTGLGGSNLEASQVLQFVEWVALGFEVIDCPFPDWRFQPVDFVAAGGFHAGLVIGEPRKVESGWIPELADQLGQFKLRLIKNGELVEEGAGKNCLKSPALCLAELAVATARQGDPLRGGEVISSGTLTTAQPVVAGEVWSVEIEGLPLEGLQLRFS